MFNFETFQPHVACITDMNSHSPRHTALSNIALAWTLLIMMCLWQPGNLMKRDLNIAQSDNVGTSMTCGYKILDNQHSLIFQIICPLRHCITTCEQTMGILDQEVVSHLRAWLSDQVREQHFDEESIQVELIVKGHVSHHCRFRSGAPPELAYANHTQESRSRTFQVQDQEPSTYEIYNLNPTELDVSVSAQLAVKLIDPPVPQKHNQPKVSFPSLRRSSRFSKSS